MTKREAREKWIRANDRLKKAIESEERWFTVLQEQDSSTAHDMWHHRVVQDPERGIAIYRGPK